MEKKYLIIIAAVAAVLAIPIVVLAIYFFLPESPGGGLPGDGPGNERPRGEFPGSGESNNDPTFTPENLSPRKVLLKNAAEYRERAKWPGYSHGITKEKDPVLRDFSRPPMQAKNPRHPKGPVLVHFAPRNSFRPDAPLVVRMYVLDANRKKIPIEDAKVHLTSGGLRGRVLDTKTPTDTDGSGDSKAGDLIYAAAFNLPAALRKKNAAPRNYTVVIKANVDGVELSATNVFNTGFLNIRHTGKFRDEIASGADGRHLKINAEFIVERSGNFHIQGSIYGKNGKAIAWAQARENLKPGRRFVTLKFFGKALCDADMDGPYTLRNFAYANVKTMPGPRSSNLKDVHTTAGYQASDFSCEPFNDPVYIKKAEVLEKQAANEK